MDAADLDYNLSVILRPFRPEVDLPMIYSTWRNACFYGSPKPIQIADKVFFRLKTEEIKDILKVAQVRMAAIEDEPDHIIGYSVHRKDHLFFIYVKKDYRGKGIGSLLMPKGIKTVSKELTKIGEKILATKDFEIK